MRIRKAFTMIELIVVIVLIAILAKYSAPRFKRDTRVEAINHILTMIRYTQNLSLHDTKYSDSNTTWQRSYWRFHIYSCTNSSGIFYKIGTDKDFNKGINRAESAIDPSNNKYTFWDTRKPCPKNSSDALSYHVSPNIFLTQKYGINKATFKPCNIYKNSITSSSKYIGFDNFGRPIKSYIASIRPNYLGHVIGSCEIKFEFIDSAISPFTIVIEPETGYTHLKD